jgi:hypothetical protein
MLDSMPRAPYAIKSYNRYPLASIFGLPMGDGTGNPPAEPEEEEMEVDPLPVRESEDYWRINRRAQSRRDWLSTTGGQCMGCEYGVTPGFFYCCGLCRVTTENGHKPRHRSSGKGMICERRTFHPYPVTVNSATYSTKKKWRAGRDGEPFPIPLPIASDAEKTEEEESEKEEEASSSSSTRKRGKRGGK